MAFEMQVVSHAPLTGEPDPQRLARLLFSMIGYTARKGPDHGVSFTLFYDCFLMHPTKEWTIEELATTCDTTLPSVYRHLNKLKDLDIIEDVYVGGEDDAAQPPRERKRAFRLRYGDLSKAWNFAEAHFHLAIENYRKSIDHLETLLQEARASTADSTADGRAARHGPGSPANPPATPPPVPEKTPSLLGTPAATDGPATRSPANPATGPTRRANRVVQID